MTAIQHIPERAPFNYADLIEYREGQITSLALVRSKGVNMTILAFDDEQLLPTHQTPGPALVQILDGTAYFTVGNEEVNLPQGKTLLIPAGVLIPSLRRNGSRCWSPPSCRWTERNAFSTCAREENSRLLVTVP